jgi:hypothetical protein
MGRDAQERDLQEEEQRRRMRLGEKNIAEEECAYVFFFLFMASRLGTTEIGTSFPTRCVFRSREDRGRRNRRRKLAKVGDWNARGTFYERRQVSRACIVVQKSLPNHDRIERVW